MSIKEKLSKAAAPTMIRVAPGEYAWVPAAHVAKIDEYVMCRWSKGTDGTYRPVPVGGRFVRLSGAVVKNLGFTDGERSLSYDTVLRLGRAGFIDLIQISPRVTLLDLDSWYRHLLDCAENTEMWDEGSEARQQYIFKNGLDLGCD